MLEAKTNQKKRARRRLVGAITLALLVVVFVPMFLDNEPKPLSEDIEIVIPPLPGDDYLEITIEDLQKQEKLATRKSKSPSARKTNKSQEKFSNSSQSGVDEVGSKRIEIGQYAVQIGAFAKFSRAQKLAKEVRKNNFNVYTENVTTDSGNRIRVRVGPFRTKEKTRLAFDRLKKLGFVEGKPVIVTVE